MAAAIAGASVSGFDRGDFNQPLNGVCKILKIPYYSYVFREIKSLKFANSFDR